MKTNRFVLSVLCVLISALPVLGKKVVPLPELLKPEDLVVDQNQLFITEFPQVYIYSLEDFKLITKFGKKGEGPREFSGYVTARPHPDKPGTIVVNSGMKVSFYTRDGEFVNEMRSKAGMIGRIYKPLGENYAAYGFFREKETGYRTVDIYNPNLEKVKEVTRWIRAMQVPGSLNPLDTDMEGGEFRVFDNKIFVLLRDKGSIGVFDRNGKKRSSIDHNFERIPVTSEDIGRFNRYYETDNISREFYKNNKDLFKYPSHFPAARSMFVTDNKIYVLTNKRQGEKSEFIIFDTGGKFLEKRMVPFENANPRVPYPWTVKSGKLYQLVDNDEEEEWELHIHELN